MYDLRVVLAMLVATLPVPAFADNPRPVHRRDLLADSPQRPARIKQLIEQLGSDEFAKRQAATKELDVIGEPALPALYRAVETEDVEVRRRVAKLLQSINARLRNQAFGEEVGEIARILKDQTADASRRREVAARLSFIARGVRPLFERLCAGLTDPDEEVRFQCALGLREFSERTSFFPGTRDIVKGLKDPSPRVRAECARALGEAIEEASLIASAAVGPLLRAMNDPDRDVRGRATGAVGLMTIRPDVAVPALLEALKVVEPRGGKQIITIRETALMALGNFGSATEAKKAVPILMDIARNEPLDGSIAMTSLAKMRHDRDKIYALFMDLLKHSPDERVRLHAIDCLGMMGADAKAAYPTLMAMLESDDGKNPFRTTCLVGAVAAVGPHDERYARAVIRVCRLYEDAACSRSTASEASTIHSTFYYLLRQLAEAGPTAKPALPMLLGLLDKHPEEPGFDFATELARAFAAIGPPAIDALVEHLKSSQLQIRIRTILVLGMIGPPAKGALPALQAIAKQSGDAHRAEAARARDSIRLINGDQGDGRVPKEAGRSAR